MMSGFTTTDRLQKYPFWCNEPPINLYPSEVGVKVPVVVRLEGNNAELGSKILAESGLNIIAAWRKLPADR